MGLITLRPFPHMIAPLWRYFHVSGYRFYLNPGLQITTTIDNVTWTEQPPPTLYTPNHVFKVVGLCYVNNTIVTGYNIHNDKEPTIRHSNQSLLWRSMDGVTWDQTTSSNNPSVNITSGNGIFVSINHASDSQLTSSTMVSTPNDWKPISTSVDGFNWFEQTVPLAVEDQYSQVLYAESEFKAIGNVSILRSTTGSTWTQQLVSFPESYFSSIESDPNDSLLPSTLNNPTFSNVVYGGGKYVYTSISPQSQGSCAANLINVSVTSGSGSVTNNVSYGCEWVVEATAIGNMIIRTSNTSYTSVVLKVTVDSVGLLDYINGVTFNLTLLGLEHATPQNPVYSETISGNKKRVYFIELQSSTFKDIGIEMVTQGFSMTSAPLPNIHIQAYPNYIYNVVAHSTTDFVTFNTSAPFIFDVRPVTDRLMAFGYADDRWVLWYNTFVIEDSCTYDYVVYSTDGINWSRATSFTLVRTNHTNPGFAEIYPTATHESIEKQYQIGYSGGSIMTSANGTDWFGWTPTPLTVL